MNDSPLFAAYHRFAPLSLQSVAGPAIVAWLLLGGLLLSGPAMAQSADSLAQMEKNLFSTSYPDEPAEARLERLETSIFGATQSGSEASRTERLGKTLLKARRWIPTAEPAAASSSNEMPVAGASDGNGAFQPAPQPQQRDATDYPTVTALERQVFGRDFIHDDVVVRLNRLEKKVYGQASPQAPLIDRVDRLLARYPGTTPTQAVSSGATASNSALQGLPSDSSQFAGSSRDIYTKLDALESRVFHKTTPNALLTERLDRLESQLYGRNYAGESVDTRVNRLISGFEVKNRHSASARPGFQSRPVFQSPGGGVATGTGTTVLPPATRPQNIQIGAGVASTSTYQFSPEMMAMLPPDVRAQMGGSGQSGTVTRAPGTVVIEQQSMATPGFQTYGSGQIQHYNYYGPTSTQTRSSTTVIQPNGAQNGQTVYSYESPFGGAPPNGLPNPAYVGNPAFLQALNQLEINVFGQVNMVESPFIRLGRLESTLLGQMYVGYPEEQRLENLQKTYQAQSIGKLLGKGKAANIGRAAGSMIMGIPLNTPVPISAPVTP